MVDYIHYSIKKLSQKINKRLYQEIDKRLYQEINKRLHQEINNVLYVNYIKKYVFQPLKKKCNPSPPYRQLLLSSQSIASVVFCIYSPRAAIGNFDMFINLVMSAGRTVVAYFQQSMVFPTVAIPPLAQLPAEPPPLTQAKKKVALKGQSQKC
ncbi:hypothetical protein BD770DRAFT_399470 [Pilaira anomala]|nr:hypothetical protein BD770DRAFT_399470 [Pilaira anomala]